MAALAAQMLNLSTLSGNDFVMECGPSSEVLPTPTSQAAGYCVLTVRQQIIFGTSIDASAANVRQSLLSQFVNGQYSSQIVAADVKLTACDGKGIGKFEECPSAIKNMRVYVMDDTSSGGLYLLVSNAPIAGFAPTGFWGTVVDFFTRWFA
jgi:hypothetical protein